MSENIPNDAHRYEDEITLYDLYRILAEKKAILLSTVIITLLLAIAYLVVVPPTYEAKLRLLPPKISTLALTTPSHPYTEFDAEDVFKEFQTQLRLSEQWRRFVADNPVLFTTETKIAQDELLRDHPIKLAADKSNPPRYMDIAFHHEETEASVSILRHYLEYSRNEYVNDLIDQVKSRIERQRENISDEIAMLRQKARLQREDEIARLRKELDLAKNLGIVDNLLVRSGDAARGGGDLTIIATNEAMRSYMRGTRVLNAELEALLARESDDPYIMGLREKEIKHEQIKNLQFQPSRFKPYTQDGDVVEPKRPIKPRRVLVLLLAIILGVVLGIVAAFIASFTRNVSLRQ